MRDWSKALSLSCSGRYVEASPHRAHAGCAPSTLSVTRSGLVLGPAATVALRMGQRDQFAKRTFASDAEQVTRGGVAWQAPPEIGLVHVQADGLLLVKDPWWIAPHVPRDLTEHRAFRRLAPGCYRVSTGIKGFDFLWVAANELPLCEELIPFLVVRSGRALDAFALWVADRRPADWVLDRVEYTTMSITVQDELLERYALDADAELRARQLRLARKLLELNPELKG